MQEDQQVKLVLINIYCKMCMISPLVLVACFYIFSSHSKSFTINSLSLLILSDYGSSRLHAFLRLWIRYFNYQTHRQLRSQFNFSLFCMFQEVFVKICVDFEKFFYLKTKVSRKNTHAWLLKNSSTSLNVRSFPKKRWRI